MSFSALVWDGTVSFDPFDTLKLALHYEVGRLERRLEMSYDGKILNKALTTYVRNVLCFVFALTYYFKVISTRDFLFELVIL